jgi:hypothetical protein
MAEMAAGRLPHASDLLFTVFYFLSFSLQQRLKSENSAYSVKVVTVLADTL